MQLLIIVMSLIARFDVKVDVFGHGRLLLVSAVDQSNRKSSNIQTTFALANLGVSEIDFWEYVRIPAVAIKLVDLHGDLAPLTSLGSDVIQLPGDEMAKSMGRLNKLGIFGIRLYQFELSDYFDIKNDRYKLEGALDITAKIGDRWAMKPLKFSEHVVSVSKD